LLKRKNPLAEVEVTPNTKTIDCVKRLLALPGGPVTRKGTISKTTPDLEMQNSLKHSDIDMQLGSNGPKLPEIINSSQ